MPLEHCLIFAGVLYFIAMSMTAVYFTVYDKKIAVGNRKIRNPHKHKKRIPEKTLLIIGALSGCIAMYITMRVIHHKTKHMKFMAGLPLIMLTEFLIVFFVWRILF